MGAFTEDLMKSLDSTRPVNEVLEDKSTFLITQSLSEALASLLQKKGLSRAQVIRNASLNTIYGHQIFSGSRTPSRNKLLAIAFGMNLDLEETNLLLKQQGYPQLYPRIERDAMIIYGFLHKLSLLDTNTMLYENNQETLI